MSTSFEIYPTNDNIPEFTRIISKSLNMFKNFLKVHNIKTYINTESYAVHENQAIYTPPFITDKENTYNTIELNKIGNIYLFYIKLDNTDTEMWDYELKTNPRAKLFKNSILKNRKIGYLWQIKRTAGQPAVVSLFYGFVAMAIAQETDGFIYSDDGAWSYELFPTEWKSLYSEYLDINKIKDHNIKSTIIKWINSLKRSR